ncbi:Hypothetical predicted protein [Cloeon dipterum]|uniref:Uncharacterized protein n=1 Tax=Cloeon dipterum TaxID=197152 RepID=A0A8S1DUF3_9INSE|nr:Hypothetical predicted protein [Cloeon dipterum]
MRYSGQVVVCKCEQSRECEHCSITASPSRGGNTSGTSRKIGGFLKFASMRRISGEAETTLSLQEKHRKGLDAESEEEPDADGGRTV